jgi:YidC/Oxa1 family membrane protein insertase
MSKNQPAPAKPNLLQNALVFAILFLIFNYFMGQMKGPTETRSAEQILSAMKESNAKVKDLTIAREFGTLKSKLSAEKLPAAQKDLIEYTGAILVADTELKAGILRNDLGRLNTAYTTLQGYENSLATKPVWNQPVQVADETKDSRLGWKQWAGATLYKKSVEILDEHNKNTLVWGFFPGYQMIDFLVKSTGSSPAFSYTFVAVFLAVVVRAILYPLSQKQMMYSRQMQQLMPLANEIKEKYKGNPQETQVKTMELYKEYGLNPMAGCLPMLLQLPLIYLVYQCMIHYRFEFQKGVFLWINPAGHQAFPAIIAPNLGQKDLILLTLYGVSMIVTSLLMPVADPANAKQQRIMGISVSAMVAVSIFFYPALPSAFVLYWTMSNILATAQSLMIYRTPMQPLVKKNTIAGGVYPTDPSTNGNGRKNGSIGPIGPGVPKTGTPAKHKPKKRK